MTSGEKSWLKHWKRGAAERLKYKHLEGLRPIAGSITAVPLLDAKHDQCRATIDYPGGLLEGAVVCGEPVVDKPDGKKASWCENHYARYMVAPVRRRPITFKPSLTMWRENASLLSSAAAQDQI